MTQESFKDQDRAAVRIECSRILFEDFLFYGIINLQDGIENLILMCHPNFLW